MKSLVFICGTILVVLTCNVSATDVSGDVWGVWTADNSPYNVVGSIRVPPDSSLIIEAGVQVVFSRLYTLTIDSNALFIAQGTLQDTIIFSGGRGIRLNYPDSDSRFEYCSFHDIGGERWGAVVVVGSYIRLDNCLLKRNAAISIMSFQNGAGISLVNTTATIENCHITENWALPGGFEPWGDASGGGIYSLNSTLNLRKCIINNNIAEGFQGSAKGGGIFLENSNAILENNTITRNLAHFFEYMTFEDIHLGSGIYLRNSNISINNNIIWGNTVSDVYIHSGSLEITYSDIGDSISGDGNIYSDPMFADSTNNDFHLLFGSPCINTGDPNSPLDPDSTRADMGAFFYDFRTDIDELTPLPTDFILYQNYPNPFNAQTTISYSLAETGRARLIIYNIIGQQVATLIDEVQAAGEHKVVWNANYFNSGIYLVKLTSNNNSIIRKALILK